MPDGLGGRYLPADDVAEADPKFGVASAKLLDLKRAEGLTICPVTYIELAPVFNGDQAAQKEFLFNLGLSWPEAWTELDTGEAQRAWHRYVAARRTLAKSCARCNTARIWTSVSVGR